MVFCPLKAEEKLITLCFNSLHSTESKVFKALTLLANRNAAFRIHLWV